MKYLSIIKKPHVTTYQGNKTCYLANSNNLFNPLNPYDMF